MPRRKSEPHEFFVFEIKSWEPTYTLSVNSDRDRPGDFVEFVELQFETVCTLPEKVAGRKAHFILSGRRDYLDPPRRPGALEEPPKSIGLLTLSPSGGGFYAGVPHESIPIFMCGLSSGQFRYIMLSGTPLHRGKSSVFHLHLERSAD